MKKVVRLVLACFLASVTAQAVANEGPQGCKDNPLFSRMPNYHLYDCKSSEFDAKQMPIGFDANDTPLFEMIEGAYSLAIYQLDEGAQASSPVQISRNLLNAAKAAGGMVVKEFPGTDYRMLGEWSDIQQSTATIKLLKAGHEYWVHLGSVNDGDYYAIAMVDRQAMQQAVSINEVVDQMNRDGFLTLEVHFDTAKAVIRAESKAALDQAAQVLKAAPELKAEVAGHTDNAGTADANLTLSQQRSESVRTALIKRGVAAARLTAKGYGQSNPVADNRTEEGRGRNRRVELVKK